MTMASKKRIERMIQEQGRTEWESYKVCYESTRLSALKSVSVVANFESEVRRSRLAMIGSDLWVDALWEINFSEGV